MEQLAATLTTNPLPSTIASQFGEEIEQMRLAYEERYNVAVSWLDAKNFLEAELEAAFCENCRGLPCKKARNAYVTPYIDEETVRVSWCICPFQKLLLFKQNFRLAKVPTRYAGKTFDDYRVTNDNERAVRIALKYIRDKPNKGLYLYGGYGTGKTFLASLIAKDFISAGKTVIFGDMPELLDELKRTFDSKDLSEAEILERYCECDLLIMDDVGAGQLTAWKVGTTYKIINRRYNADKPTIITSNLELDDLKVRLRVKDNELDGGRIVSRLADKDAYVICFFGTNDRRRQ